MYNNAPSGKMVTAIHMFGIIYGNTIKEKNYSQTKIIEEANINPSYSAELYKGINIGEELNSGKYDTHLNKQSDTTSDTTIKFAATAPTPFSLPKEFSSPFSRRYITSLLAKPFVILTGNSGTGKTRIAKQFAEYLEKSCGAEKNWLLVPVGADWTDNTKILGFYNPLAAEGKGKYEKSEIFRLIENANANPDIPFFLILDEMNLSHVERYFSDFLSRMETPDSAFNIDHYGSLPYPKNLFVTGTVNIDETTYMFSPKVLDRANVIEFKPEKDDVLNLIQTPAKTSGKTPQAKDGVAEGFLELAKHIWDDETTVSAEDLKNARDALDKLYTELENSDFEFAYRTVKEIRRYISASYELKTDSEFKITSVLDEQIVQKILPKIHGNQKQIGELLNNLENLCPEKEFHLSFSKIQQMKKSLSQTQYASFI